MAGPAHEGDAPGPFDKSIWPTVPTVGEEPTDKGPLRCSVSFTEALTVSNAPSTCRLEEVRAPVETAPEKEALVPETGPSELIPSAETELEKEALVPVISELKDAPAEAMELEKEPVVPDTDPVELMPSAESEPEKEALVPDTGARKVAVLLQVK